MISDVKFPALQNIEVVVEMMQPARLTGAVWKGTDHMFFRVQAESRSRFLKQNNRRKVYIENEVEEAD